MFVKDIFKDKGLQEIFNKQGYVYIPLIESEGLEQLNVLFDKFKDQHPNNTSLSYNISAYSDDKIYKQKIDKAASEIVKIYLDKVFIDYTLIGSTFAYKVPNKKAILAPHQEWTMVDENRYVCITCWIPLMDITHKNGVVYVLPGSHLQKYRTIRGIGIDFYYSKYNEEIYHYGIPVKAKAGHVLIMNQNLIHYSTPNFSNAVRRALITSIKSAEAIGTFLYYKSKNSMQIEKYLVDDDFLMKSDDFFDKIVSKPDGKLVEVLKDNTPEYSRSEIRKLFENMLLESEFCKNKNEVRKIKTDNYIRRIKNFFQAI